MTVEYHLTFVLHLPVDALPVEATSHKVRCPDSVDGMQVVFVSEAKNLYSVKFIIVIDCYYESR